MKKQILFTLIVALATCVCVKAQTIALHSSTGVQIFNGNTALADAYVAANNGDTLYLSGNTFTPPSVFDKSLMIFGAGFYTDSTLATGKTFINGSIDLNENADNFYLEGVEVTGDIRLYNDKSINNVKIKRCKINGVFRADGNLSNPSSNLSLIGNIFMGYLYLDNTQTALLSNNIIVQSFRGSNGNMINNNIILGYISYTSYTLYLFMGNNNILNNNIILWSDMDARASGTGNFFYNNLYVTNNPSYGTTPTASGNYTGVAQSAIFINQTGSTFDYAHDYHLQNSGAYLGTDGTEVGIYGGIFPYKEGAVPVNPHIQFRNIAPTTDANGDLQIQIQVEAQED